MICIAAAAVRDRDFKTNKNVILKHRIVCNGMKHQRY